MPLLCHRGTLICVIRASSFALAALALASCKSVEVPKVPGVTPYRMVIQQGNFISQEMVDQLKPGMTREQVRFILGTPLVADIFHAERWDYVFFREMPNGKKEQRNLSVIFEKDKLARVVGDLLPAEGATPRSTGFAPQVKPEPPKPAAAAEKPPAATEKPPADAAKAVEAAKPQSPAPAPAAEDKSWEPTKSNWSTASPEPAKAAEPEKKAEPERKADPAPVAKEEEKKTDDAPKERGFFGRMLEKIGL